MNVRTTMWAYVEVIVEIHSPSVPELRQICLSLSLSLSVPRTRPVEKVLDVEMFFCC